MKMKLFGLIETKLFHFHRLFKNGGQGGGCSNPLLNPSGSAHVAIICKCGIFLVTFPCSCFLYEGQSKITEPYLITFEFGIVDNKCDYFL